MGFKFCPLMGSGSANGFCIVPALRLSIRDSEQSSAGLENGLWKRIGLGSASGSGDRFTGLVCDCGDGVPAWKENRD